MKTTRINIRQSEPSTFGFGVTDRKGRVVGFSRQASAFDVVETTGDHGYHAGEPGHYFRITGCGTRNGRDYGSAVICISGLCKATVEKQFAACVARARRAAVKKFAQPA